MVKIGIRSKAQEMIELELDRIERSKRGQIACPIYFSFEGQHFPELGWFDSPVVILNWWMNAYLNVKHGLKKRVEFLFMEGQCKLRVQFIVGGKLYIECLWGREKEEVEASFEVKQEDLEESLQNATSKLLKVCDDKNWESEDIKKLRVLSIDFKAVV